jgi:hypothetical protein
MGFLCSFSFQKGILTRFLRPLFCGITFDYLEDFIIFSKITGNKKHIYENKQISCSFFEVLNLLQIGKQEKKFLIE